MASRSGAPTSTSTSTLTLTSPISTAIPIEATSMTSRPPLAMLRKSPSPPPWSPTTPTSSVGAVLSTTTLSTGNGPNSTKVCPSVVEKTCDRLDEKLSAAGDRKKMNAEQQSQRMDHLRKESENLEETDWMYDRLPPGI